MNFEKDDLVIDEMIESLCIKLLLSLYLFACIGFLGKHQVLISLGSYGTVFIIILLCINCLIRNTRKKDVVLILLGICLLLSNMIIKMNLRNCYTDLRDYMYIGTISLILIFIKDVNVKKQDLNLLAVICTIITVLFLIYSNDNTMYTYHSFSGSLELNFSNSNVLGSVILINMISIKLSYKMYSIKLAALCSNLLVLVNIYLLYLTNSRTALFSAILFLILLCLVKKKNIIIRMINKYCVYIPILIILSTNIIDQISRMSIFDVGDKGSLGLNVRDELWYNTIYNLFNSGSTFMYGAKEALLEITPNPHNSYLYIAWKLGIPILIYILFLFRNTVKSTKKYSPEEIKSIVVIGFFVIMINNSFEIHLVSGIMSVTFLSIFLLSNFEMTKK